MNFILIIGAKSDVAMSLARIYAEKNFNLYLAGRNISELSNFAQDLSIRFNITVSSIEMDLNDFKSHKRIYDSLTIKPIGVISFVGYLGNQTKAQKNFSEASRIIDSNFKGIVSILNIVANDFEKRKSGWIVGVSSVAGDRGRATNYIYGSAKSALSVYLSGLRNRLFKSNVQVLSVKPGFINTKMTKDIDMPKILTANPDLVAKAIYSAQKNKKDVIYVKKFWRVIMLIIKNIPELIFKRMKI